MSWSHSVSIIRVYCSNPNHVLELHLTADGRRNRHHQRFWFNQLRDVHLKSCFESSGFVLFGGIRGQSICR